MSDQPTKRKQAAAIRYDIEKDDAPVVVAVGQGVVAEHILEMAQEHNIPVKEDANLAGGLGKMNPGQAIPAELYEIVAQVLLFVAQADSDYGKRLSRGL